MNFKKSFILMPLLATSLFSCGRRDVIHDLDDYILECPTKYDSSKGFNIIQITDTHIGNMCDRKLQYKFIQKTIDKSNEYLQEKYDNENLKADLIVITGDLFTFATRDIAKEYFAFFDKQEIPWTVCFGNHDEQAYYSLDWLTGYLNDLNTKREESNSIKLESYCVFKDNQDDDVFGNSNFVINVRNDNEEIVERLYFLDSNKHNFKYNGYDTIHEDQIKWFRMFINYDYSYEPQYCPQGLVFFHIPLPEFNDAVDNEGKVKSGWYFLEDDDKSEVLDTRGEHASSPNKEFDTHFYKTLINDNDEELNGNPNIRGVFVGHNHINGWAAKNIEKNFIFSFGVKATDTVDKNEESLGGQLIMINKNFNDKKDFEDNNFTIHQVKHKYQDLDKEAN